MNDVTSLQIVEQFWATMNTNDWRAAAAQLHDDYVLDYPQSRERFRGRENFVAINANYPAAGRWRFDVQRLVAAEDACVSDVAVTNGARDDRVVTFFELRGGRIWRMTEYWPDPFEAAPWRAVWAERFR